MDNPSTNGAPPRVDLEQVAHLVEQLERDLARVRAGGATVDTLRTEVEQLRQALAAADPHGKCTRGCTACASASEQFRTSFSAMR